MQEAAQADHAQSTRELARLKDFVARLQSLNTGLENDKVALQKQTVELDTALANKAAAMADAVLELKVQHQSALEALRSESAQQLLAAENAAESHICDLQVVLSAPRTLPSHSDFCRACLATVQRCGLMLKVDHEQSSSTSSRHLDIRAFWLHL